MGDNKIYNNIRQNSGSAEHNYFTGHVLVNDISTVSTSGTGEDDLSSGSIPAKIMDKHNFVIIKASGTKSNGSGESKTIKFYFCATSITLLTGNTSAEAWSFHAEIKNTTTASQKINWEFKENNSSLAVGIPNNYDRYNK